MEFYKFPYSGFVCETNVFTVDFFSSFNNKRVSELKSYYVCFFPAFSFIKEELMSDFFIFTIIFEIDLTTVVFRVWSHLFILKWTKILD